MSSWLSSLSLFQIADYTAMWNAIKGGGCSEQPAYAVRPAVWGGIQARGG